MQKNKNNVTGNKDERVKKSLWYSIMDGSFWAAMVGFGESFFAAFAIFLGATSTQLGLLGSLPQALGSVSQLFTKRLLRLFGNSRQRFIGVNAFLTALMYIPIALVYFFGTFKVWHLILFVCIYWTLGAIVSPAWNSWMGDLVPENERGSYFGRRNKITGFVTFASLLTAGYILQAFGKGTSTEYYGFMIIFGLALVGRIFSFIFLSKKYEPKYEPSSQGDFGFIAFLKQARFTNYGHFVFYLSLMNFAVYLSSPFFAAYMLYDLKFDYMTFTIVTATAIIVKFLMMPVWGKVSDRYGTKTVLTLTGMIMPMTPILWLFSHEIWYLILIQAFSGFVWAGFELASFNFIFDTTTPEKRATCVAYYNVLNGIFIFAGAMLGALIVRYSPLHTTFFWSIYLIVFLVSGVLRYFVSFYFLPKLKEVRQVKRIKQHELLLRVIASSPTMGMMSSMITFSKKHKREFANSRINMEGMKKVKRPGFRELKPTIEPVIKPVLKPVKKIEKKIESKTKKTVEDIGKKIKR